MKKKILALAVAIATVGTFSSFAASDKDQKCDKQQCSTQQCDKSRKECKGERKCPNPFEGINLTADQQTKLKALKGSACCKTNKDEVKAACAKQGDCKSKDGRVDPRQAKRDYLVKIKEILTPEQYVVFLENSFANIPRMDKGQRPGRHGDKKDMKHNRGQRPQVSTADKK